ncbi:hypothetical protein EB796_010543 [Bugula neritina]|uniref:Rho-GAP domain-containing protein n=1 Tax=Bugula neritina TaxID=10212 RepID=A0A7J7JZ78_BUGNE|nr:hypothetical protein EB796_010543 [Bugula neritina]
MEETINSKSPNKKILNEQTKLQGKYLSKLRDCHYSYLIELGKLHISFITELSYDVFDQELNSRYKDSDNNCGKPLVKCKKEKSRNHLSSGSSINDLDQINAFESEAITAAVDVLCSHLQKQENISQEGIFRKCGNVARQKELKGSCWSCPTL